MSKPEIFRNPISRSVIKRLAEESFEDMVKFVVDIDRKLICAGGGLHSDEEQALLEEGSPPHALWGGNYYLDDPSDARFEFTSMINVRPHEGNTAQQIQSETLRRKVYELAKFFFES